MPRVPRYLELDRATGFPLNEAGSPPNFAAGNQNTYFQRIEIGASQLAVHSQIEERPFRQALLAIEEERDCPNVLFDYAAA